jgi:aspartyl-tRNA(Asn)/glutamyl-tRNA(Gln) amidotransferase subunit B
MVTEPDLRTADEAAQYIIRLRQLLRWLGISEGDMERGNLRCDANVSIRPTGSTILNQKTEIKNVNSIDSLREAILKEIERQEREVAGGNAVKAWTLEWDQDSGVLRKMRSKETEADYRYFREPDLLPLEISAAWKNEILKEFPELPLVRRERFMQTYGLPEYDADILTQERALSDYFEACSAAYAGDPKRVSNWLMNDVLRVINEGNLNPAEMLLTPQHLADLIRLVDAGTINITTGKTLLQPILESGKAPGVLVDELGLKQVRDDDAIRAACRKVLEANPDEEAAYRDGKETLMGWFVGQVMREMHGKADAQLVRQNLSELLK